MSALRVLFVDDEPLLLRAFRALFRKQRDVWDMTFLGSAEEALAAMAEKPFDVVLSDMRMPRMDGEKFLREVLRRHPQTARFIFSGQTDMKTAVRSVSIAHQFFSKPCDPDVLRAVVERTCGVLRLVADNRIRAWMGAKPVLPSLPRIYCELAAALAREASIDVIAGIVERDIALTAKLLQLINSAFFGAPRNVSSVRQAVRLLGVGVLRAIATSLHLSSNFTPRSALAATMFEEIQEHSIRVARRAQQLCSDPVSAELAFAAGMLHDIGRLALLAQCEDEYLAAIARARAEGRPSVEVEREMLGINHAEVAAYMLGLWGLPIDVVEAVVFHGAPPAHADVPGAPLSPGAAFHLAHRQEREERAAGTQIIVAAAGGAA